MKNHQIIIVGGGVAGLTAAIFLARENYQVTLLEKSNHVGGRAITEEKKGFHFNLGPHALYAGGAGAKILHALQIPFHGDKPSSSGAYAVERGRKHTMPNGAVSLMTTSLLGFAGKMEAGKLLNNLSKIDTAPIMDLTLDEWAEREIVAVEVRALVQALCRVSTYACDSSRHSAGAALAQLQMAISSGVFYLDNGWQTLVNGLRNAAEKAGVKILAQHKAEKILREKNVRGVLCSAGNELPADAVILAVTPAEADVLTENNFQWSKQTIPVRAACLDVALETLPQPRTTFGLGIDAPLYFSVHSASAQLTPNKNGAMIHVAKYLQTNEKTNASTIEQELADFLELLQPNWRPAVVAKRFLPNITVSHALVTAAQGAYAGRTAVQINDAPGLFLAGDWVGNQGMLVDASFASANTAAQLTQKYLSSSAQ